MKKVLSLVLALAVVLSLSVSLSATTIVANPVASPGTSYGGSGQLLWVSPIQNQTADEAGWLWLGPWQTQPYKYDIVSGIPIVARAAGTSVPGPAIVNDVWMYTTFDDWAGYDGYYPSTGGVYSSYLGTSANIMYNFRGPSTTEVVTATANKDVIGVNGNKIDSIRVSFNRNTTNLFYAGEWAGGNSAPQATVPVLNNTNVVNTYTVSLTLAADTTVEVTEGYKIDANIGVLTQNITWGGKQEVVPPSKVANRRFFAEDVVKAPQGWFVIDATAKKYPVVDTTAVQKAWGAALVVRYPDYTLVIDKVTNQNYSFWAYAEDLSKLSTVHTDKSLIQAFYFPDVYIKDNVTLEFKVRPDVLNYKASNYYTYELYGKDNWAVKADTEMPAGLQTDITKTYSGTANAVLVIKVPADTPLGAYGKNVAKRTYGVFTEPQDEEAPESTDAGSVAPPTSTPATSNPPTGAGEAVNVASVFAIVSLAAAGFVALKKSGK